MWDPRLNFLALAYRCVYAVLGGYLTACLAPRNPMRHVWVLAFIGLAMAVAGVIATRGMNLGPCWYPISLAVTALPCVWLGGILYQRMQNVANVPLNNRELSFEEKNALERTDSERKHLEGLLQNRINFYLIFIGLFLGSLYQIYGVMREVALVAGTVISFLLTLAICRTYGLVARALRDIEDIDPTHPYIKYRRDISFPPNANHVLVIIPIGVTLLFGTLTLLSMACAK